VLGKDEQQEAADIRKEKEQLENDLFSEFAARIAKFQENPSLLVSAVHCRFILPGGLANSDPKPILVTREAFTSRQPSL
jgi:adenylate kinase